MRAKPPAYQPPKHPLSAASRGKLNGLAQVYKRRLAAEKNKAAIKALAECAHDLGESLRGVEERLKREQERADGREG